MPTKKFSDKDIKYYKFLVTLSKLLEKEDIGWKNYNNKYCLYILSIFVDLHERYILKIRQKEWQMLSK